jgi:predicted acyl esterase
VFTGASSPCDRQSDQWGAGAVALATQDQNPCASDDRTMQAGPGALTYTTKPFAADRVLAGPINATVYATSTRPDTFFEATLEDIDPSGTSTSLTAGGLLGSFRALDDKQTWRAPDGKPILPYHPYTRASVTPVETGKVTRFDIEVFPTFAKIAKGHSLRLTLTTSDTPHLGFTPDQLQNLAGGVYQVQRNAGTASFVEIPTAPAGAFAKTCSICVTTG